ncbi:hypothetical protein [Kutzneria sp. NPDC052558]|uniref:hypothetical protein n=1 Tax=Kutzneria sp. NPDC052558 TaxID=3364121 RepID=UPI0037CA2779
MFRLNYACEQRYGVVADIATRIADGRPVDVTMPAVNVVWQRDVSAWALRGILSVHTEVTVLNVIGPETMPVRRIAKQSPTPCSTTPATASPASAIPASRPEP